MERYDIVCIQNLAPRNGDKMTQRETSFKTPSPRIYIPRPRKHNDRIDIAAPPHKF